MQKLCKKVDPQKVLGSKFEATRVKFSRKDLILYSLGIGFNQDPLREVDYKYTLQFHKNFTNFPTYAAIIAPLGMKLLHSHPYIPQFHPYSLLHAEERLEMFHDQLIPDALYSTQTQIVDVQEKGQNAYFTFSNQCYLVRKNAKDLAFSIHRKFYIKDLGGFGFKGTGVSKGFQIIPDRNCDYNLTANTFSSQAFIYRLSIDENPLHVDPMASTILRFDRPILHGNCILMKVLQHMGQQPEKQSNIYLIMTLPNQNLIGHVYPGESLRIQIWKMPNGFAFEAWVVERQTKCVIGEFATISIAKL